jgi:hypothetical protein
MTKCKVSDGQNLLDICLQYYGSIEALPDLCDANKLNMDSVLTTGQVLLLDDALVRDQEVVNYYAEVLGNYQVNTGDDQGAEGIGYWTIEQDFVVS